MVPTAPPAWHSVSRAGLGLDRPMIPEGSVVRCWGQTSHRKNQWDLALTLGLHRKQWRQTNWMVPVFSWTFERTFFLTWTFFGIKSCAAAVFSFAINRLLFMHGEQVARLDLLSLLWTPPPPTSGVTAITRTMWDEVIHQKACFHINAFCFYYCLAHCRLAQCAHVNFNLSRWKLQPNQRCCLEGSSFTLAELGLAAFPVQTLTLTV